MIVGGPRRIIESSYIEKEPQFKIGDTYKTGGKPYKIASIGWDKTLTLRELTWLEMSLYRLYHWMSDWMFT